MRFRLFKNTKDKNRLDELERQAHLTHQKNIKKIRDTKSNVDTLNVVLKQNNIVFQLAHVIGHQK